MIGTYDPFPDAMRDSGYWQQFPLADWPAIDRAADVYDRASAQPPDIAWGIRDAYVNVHQSPGHEHVVSAGETLPVPSLPSIVRLQVDTLYTGPDRLLRDRQCNEGEMLRRRQIWRGWRETLPFLPEGEGTFCVYETDGKEGMLACRAVAYGVASASGRQLVTVDAERMIDPTTENDRVNRRVQHVGRTAVLPQLMVGVRYRRQPVRGVTEDIVVSDAQVLTPVISASVARSAYPVGWGLRVVPHSL